MSVCARWVQHAPAFVRKPCPMAYSPLGRIGCQPGRLWYQPWLRLLLGDGARWLVQWIMDDGAGELLPGTIVGSSQKTKMAEMARDIEAHNAALRPGRGLIISNCCSRL